MDTLEVNKYAGGILSALLAAAVIGHLGDILVHSEPAEQRAVAIDTAAPSESATAEAEPAAAEESAIVLLASADPEAGKGVAKKCTTCHSLEAGGPNKVGPTLWNIVGAQKAAVDGFSYSSALQDAGGIWSYEDLDAFLTNPRKNLKGTKMAFAGVKKVKQRADLIAFLRTLSDSPQPLP
ncbi:MAG: cytochrome c family protein [Alphaproteobacteria bacterium]|nr:cytochrome c family protein [Alphaproteobacteria bacterium]